MYSVRHGGGVTMHTLGLEQQQQKQKCCTAINFAVCCMSDTHEAQNKVGFIRASGAPHMAEDPGIPKNPQQTSFGTLMGGSGEC
mmetsp:Transcript_9726/g.17130  ORF Transcript_9726/g.17130 Transcript_9726/m.17130 type:complete len:84 (+) Transcript_9726:141-392(+)